MPPCANVWSPAITDKRDFEMIGPDEDGPGFLVNQRVAALAVKGFASIIVSAAFRRYIV